MTSIIGFENDSGIIVASDTMVTYGDYIENKDKYLKVSKDVYVFVSGNAAALDAIGFIYGQKDDADKKFIDTGEFNRRYAFHLCQRVCGELNKMNVSDSFCILLASKKGMCVVDSTGYITPTPIYNFIGLGLGRYSTVAYMDSYARWSDIDMHKCPISLLEVPIQLALEYTSDKVNGVRGCSVITIHKE